MNLDHTPTQSTSTLNMNVFSDTYGQPLSVFVEPGGIHNRPQLVRRLRNNGANICKDPKEANVILVDPPTSQGRSFIRNWGNHPGTTVLDYRWASKCLEVKHALLDDDFGGFIAEDDGLDHEGSEGEPDVPNPLPTPRDTPVESPQQPPAPTATKPKKRRPSVLKPLSPPRQTLSDGEQRSPSPPLPAPSAASSSNIPTPLSGGFFSGVPQQQFNIQPSAWYGQMGQMPPQASAPPGMPPIDPNMALQFLSNPAILSALHDVMRLGGPAGMPGVQMPMAPNHFAPPAPAAWPPQIPSVTSGSTPLYMPNPSYTSDKDNTPQYLDTPPEEFSLNNEELSDRPVAPPPKRRKTSTKSAASPAAAGPSHQRTAAPSTHKIFTKKNGKPSNFYVQIQLHNRPTVVTAIKKHGGVIVSGPESADYAILSSNGHDFATLFQSAFQAGTPAVSSKWVTTCVENQRILDTSEFEFDQPQTKKRQPKVKTEPVDEDLSLFEEERRRAAQERKERKNEARRERREAERQAAMKTSPPSPLEPSPVASTSAQVLSQAPQSVGPVPVGPEAGLAPVSHENASTSRKRKSKTSTSSKSTGSPPPPAPVMLPAGHYKFTDEEIQYALGYAKRALDRDYTASITSITNVLYKRMPHHSLGSWRTFTGTRLQDEIEAYRKRAGIEFRKREHSQGRGESMAAAASPPGSASMLPAGRGVIDTGVEESGPESAQTTEEMLEKDLNVAAEFFAGPASGFDSDEEDNTIWEALTNTTPCLTAPTWEEFYNEHHEEVIRRYSLLTGN